MKKKLFSLLVSFAIGIAIFATNMYVRMDDGKIITFDTGKIKEVFFGEDTDILPSDTIPSDTTSVIPIPVDTTVVDSLANTLKYKVASDSTASVIGCYDKSKISGDIVIPDSVEIDGKEYIVTEIYGYVFEGCVNLDSVFIPFNAYKIGGHAFEGCVNLKLVIDNWFDNLEYGMLGFSGVDTVIFLRKNPINPPLVVKESDAPFKFNILSDTTVEVAGLTKLTDSVFIPEKVLIDHKLYTVVRIGQMAFEGNTSITNVTFPSTLRTLSDGAFHGCTGLKNVTVPSNVVKIDAAFYGCENLDLVIENYRDSVEYDERYSFFGCKSVTFTKDSSAVVPVPVDTTKNDSILTDTIPTDTILTDTIKIDSLGLSLQLEITDSTATIVRFNSELGYTSVIVPSKVVVDGKEVTITMLGERCFSGASKVTEIKLPETIGVISDAAFHNCSNLKSINIPNGVSAIGSYAFAECSSLDSIFLPFSVSRIEGRAFYNSVKLNVVVDNWYENVDYGMYGFLNVHSVTYLRENPINPPFVVKEDDITYLSFNILSDTTVEVSSSSWDKDSIVIPEKVLINHRLYNVIQIGLMAFAENTHVASVSFPSTLSTLSDGAFHGCTGLMNVTVPSNVVKFGAGAFYECSNLDLVIENYRDSVEYNEKYSFFGCKSVTFTKDSSAVVPVPVDTTKNDTIKIDSLGLSLQLKITDSTAAIVGFNSELGYTSVIVPSKVVVDGKEVTITMVGERGFTGATNVTEIKLPETVGYIDDAAFNNCLNLKSINIPDGVGVIGAYAFAGCTSLDSLFIPSSVYRFGTHAFDDCPNLDIVVDNYDVEYGLYAISGCRSIKYLREDPFVGVPVVDAEDLPIGFTPIKRNEAALNYSNLYADLDSVVIPARIKLYGEIRTVTSIGGFAFMDCTHLKYVEIPFTVTNISEYAFRFEGSEELEVVIDNSKENVTIDDTAFDKYKSITYKK